MTFNARDLTAPTERDLQRLTGNTIDTTMADITLDPSSPIRDKCTHPHRFAINRAMSAMVAVVRTMPAAPPLLTFDGIRSARPSLTTGLPHDTATLHATFGHVSRDALRATCNTYTLPIPRFTPTCVNACVSVGRAAVFLTRDSFGSVLLVSSGVRAEALMHIEVASLNNASEPTIVTVVACRKLTTLTLSFCKETFVLPERIGDCAALTTLKILCCPGLTALPERLGDCAALMTLNLSNCPRGGRTT